MIEEQQEPLVISHLKEIETERCILTLGEPISQVALIPEGIVTSIQTVQKLIIISILGGIHRTERGNVSFLDSMKAHLFLEV